MNRHRRTWSSDTAIITGLGLTSTEMKQVEHLRQDDDWTREQLAEANPLPENAPRITEVRPDAINYWVIYFSTNVRHTLEEFREFHRQLKRLFLVEAGINGHARSLPSFPKRLTWLTCTRERAIGWLQVYLSELMALPVHIKSSKFFVSFFHDAMLIGSERTEPEYYDLDYSPITAIEESDDNSNVFSDSEDDSEMVRIHINNGVFMFKRTDTIDFIHLSHSFTVIYYVDADGDAIVVDSLSSCPLELFTQ